ncbi:hypothetical protein [Methylobacillus flagellatus]|uniref:hypothetical protein n=1 Tax=Methylobacillus flagellatus TaxID=405 RepID=UPI0028694239|nr:hypothetical protein [Methylobacillus flagellatus]
MSLRDQLAQCEEHTRQQIGQAAANRLGNWRQYQTNDELVMFIQRLIRNQNNLANGWELDRHGYVSIESIVLASPDFFTEQDAQIARQTLGRS